MRSLTGFISGSVSGAASGEPGWVAAVGGAVGKEATDAHHRGIHQADRHSDTAVW